MLTMISWQNMFSDAYSCYEKTNMKDDFEITHKQWIRELGLCYTQSLSRVPTPA